MTRFRPLWLSLAAAAVLAVAVGLATDWAFLPSTDGDAVPELSVFCFEGYAEPAWVEPFEREHGCRVRITYTGTIEEMLARTREAPDAFHLLSLDSGRVPLYRAESLLQPIPLDRLPNHGRLRPYFREHPASRGPGGRVLHVPIGWGTQTLTVNRAALGPDVLAEHLGPEGRTCSLEILADPRLRGHTAFFDEAANVVAIAALSVGAGDPHRLEAAERERVAARIRAWLRGARTLTRGVDDEYGALVGGEVWVLLGGNDALLQRRLRESDLAGDFAQYPPTEGTYCWIDGWALTAPTAGRARELALAYIDRMLSDVGQAELVRAVGFGPVTPAGAVGLDPALLESTPWYGRAIEDFPGRLVIMAAADAPLARMAFWRRLKAESDAR